MCNNTFVFVVRTDGDEGDEIDECGAVFAVVDEGDLAFLFLEEGAVEMADGVGGGV